MASGRYVVVNNFLPEVHRAAALFTLWCSLLSMSKRGSLQKAESDITNVIIFLTTRMRGIVIDILPPLCSTFWRANWPGNGQLDEEYVNTDFM